MQPTVCAATPASEPMIIANDEELQGILATGRVVADVRDAMLAAIEPGMTTLELDDIGRALLAAAGARSAPEVMYDFPGATCISVNEQAAHGIPGARVIGAGDIVNVDVSAEMGGFYADTGGTMVVPGGADVAGGPTMERKQLLCDTTVEALAAALETVRAGSAINRIGKAAQNVARKHGFKMIENLAGHGIGRSLHEPPAEIVCYYDRDDRRRLQKGHVIAVEPFLSTRSTWVKESGDGWTLVGEKGNLSAQFEHTVIVTTGAPIIATLSADLR